MAQSAFTKFVRAGFAPPLYLAAPSVGTHEYMMRLATVCMTVLALLLVAWGVLLLPADQFLSIRIASQETELATLRSALGNARQQAAVTGLTAFDDNLVSLATLANAPAASPALRAALAVAHPGVHLLDVSWSASVEGGFASMTISGIADTRNALHAYDLALGQAPGIASADLPASAYAPASAIPFTITVEGASVSQTP